MSLLVAMPKSGKTSKRKPQGAVTFRTYISRVLKQAHRAVLVSGDAAPWSVPSLVS